MIERKKIVPALISATLLTLVGCGQKGPLYIADEEVQQNKPQQEEQTETTKEQP